MHYLLGDDRFTPWGQEIERALGRRAQEQGKPADGPVTVAELRRWIRDVSPAHGLRDEVADLVIIAWAALRQRAWFQQETALPVVPEPGSLNPVMELRTQELPSADEWETARTVAGAMLGIAAGAYLTAPAVADFVGQVATKAAELSKTAPGLVGAIEAAYRRLEIADGNRLRTAKAGSALMQQLRHLDGVKLVQVLAKANLGDATPVAAGKSLASADAVDKVLTAFPWHRLDPLREAMKGEGSRAADAAAVVNGLRSALEQDELPMPIGRALTVCEDGIFSWLAGSTAPPADPEPKPRPPVVSGPKAGSSSRAGGTGNSDIMDQVRAFLDDNPDVTVEVTWRVLP
jgi:hypothetical protein